MTPEEQFGEEAFRMHQQILETEGKRRAMLAKNIELIVDKMKDGGMYKAIVGDENLSWQSYLAQLDVFYSRAEVSKWYKIYKKLVKKMGFDLYRLANIPFRRVWFVCRFAKDTEQADALLSMAESLTNHDWKIEELSHRGKKSSEDCKHSNLEEYEICSDCGMKMKKNHLHKFNKGIK